jgi:phosphoribosylformylglycinamidine synthase
LIYLLGTTFNELGGSQYYYWLMQKLGNKLPEVRPELAQNTFQAVYQAVQRELIVSCHDLSEGGLAVALAEMCFAGGLGAEISLASVPVEEPLRNYQLLFSESNSRFLVEVPRRKSTEFESLLKDLGAVFGMIGATRNEPELKIYGVSSREVVIAKIDELKKAWQSTFNW